MRSELLEGLFHRFVPAFVDDVLVGEDDLVEVPFEYPVRRAAHLFPVAEEDVAGEPRHGRLVVNAVEEREELLAGVRGRRRS